QSRAIETYRLPVLDPVGAIGRCGDLDRIAVAAARFARRQGVGSGPGRMGLDRGPRYPLENRLLRGIEMHGADVAHDIERIAIFGDAAAAADRRSGAGQPARMQQTEIVTELMAVYAESGVTVAVWPAKADIGQPSPAAGIQERKDVKAILVNGLVGRESRRVRCVRPGTDRLVVPASPRRDAR